MAERSVFSFKGRMESIQVMRACLAFLIFLSHFESLNYLNLNLSAPVFLFYSISGFVCMLSTRKSEKVRGFLKRRFVRLLPLYWVLTVLTFAIAQVYHSFMSYTPDFVQLIKSLFCIPFARESAATESSIMRPIVGPAHTLEVEIIFSVIFFICMKISHKHRGKIASGVCLVFFITGMAFEIFKVKTGVDIIEFYITHNRYAWLYFLVGIAVYKVFEILEAKSVSVSSLKTFFILSVVFSVAIFAAILTTHDMLGADIYYSLQAVAAFFVLSALTILSQYNVRMPRPLVFYGNISLSFYLLHYYIVHLTESILGVKAFGWLFILAVIIAFAVSITVAFVSYLMFEKKLPELILHGKKKKAKQTIDSP